MLYVASSLQAPHLGTIPEQLAQPVFAGNKPAIAGEPTESMPCRAPSQPYKELLSKKRQHKQATHRLIAQNHLLTTYYIYVTLGWSIHPAPQKVIG